MRTEDHCRRLNHSVVGMAAKLSVGSLRDRGPHTVYAEASGPARRDAAARGGVSADGLKAPTNHVTHADHVCSTHRMTST